MWKRIRSFYRGLREWRPGMTTKYKCESRQAAYELGRVWGRRLSPARY
ncbi:hypothetical protein [Xanthomonas phage RTH11]|nr:hypothetical protein [Xanthomonas phage RTH11]